MIHDLHMCQEWITMMPTKMGVPLLLVAIFLSGCATPVFMLKNERTGQIARCGGEASGSMAGGLIGYNIQKKTDKSCVTDYESRGFTPIQK
jgi:hypothetical protein